MTLGGKMNLEGSIYGGEDRPGGGEDPQLMPTGA